MNQPPDLGNLLPRFFTEHLVQQRNLSPRTVAAYRDTFRLLLRFLQRARKTTASSLPLTALNAPEALAFLSHLESKRRNCVRSRNARLAAIRSFVHYAGDLLGPALPEATRRILSIPSKRHTQPMLGFLTKEEVQAILSCCGNSWSGQRDHLLFLLLYNTGARVSEVIPLRVRDVLDAEFRYLALHGKGRKQRVVPLWRKTQRLLRHWVKQNKMSPESPLLPNRFGQALSRSGVAWQLRHLTRKASANHPSLRNRRISPHTFRHTTAMHLLQAGVAHEVIALWLGHESPSTTHLYVEADLDMKRRTLDTLAAPKTNHATKPIDDQLLRFLEGL